jgi:transcriptional regulator with GAF, ATPase, and Fis domain
MQPAGIGDETRKTSASVILEVAKAISVHLDLTDMLAAMVVTLKSLVQFDSIGIVVRDGDYAKLHSLHIEGLHRQGNETVQSMLERKASALNIEPLQARIPIGEHHMNVI